jgi:hypothetical protein
MKPFEEKIKYKRAMNNLFSCLRGAPMGYGDFYENIHYLKDTVF